MALPDGTYKHGIVPHTPVYFKPEDGTIVSEAEYFNHQGSLDLKAICIFAACGFFLDEDTHYTNLKALKPATDYTVSQGRIIQKRIYFNWYNEPVHHHLKEATLQFKSVFEHTVHSMAEGKRVILPLSGGLDSRSLAAALSAHPEVQAYSYEFKGGEQETYYSRKIAEVAHFPFHGYQIEKGYLWKAIDALASLNNCTSEFTHPRQMAVIDTIEKLGNTFFLGHWGDVLFDGMGVPDDLSFDDQVKMLYKKVLKKGGEPLGEALWKHWNLEGTFGTYLKERLMALMGELRMKNANSNIRAFKSLYWAPRWTSSNLSIFRRKAEIRVPYYSDVMCELICTIPESLLDGRKIQIEYLKQFYPDLAKIKWQGYGLDLYHYQNFYKWYNIPNRALERLKRLTNSTDKIKRNWELQFLGPENEQQLLSYLNHPDFQQWIAPDIAQETYQNFLKDGVQYAHPLSILLTLSLFSRKHQI